MNDRLLVISPHPDDETLGAGGTILKYKKDKNRVFWLNITNMKAEHGYKPEEVSQRSSEIRKVIEQYRFDGYFDLSLRPKGMDRYPLESVILEIDKVVSKVRPQTVILPYEKDAHSDHRIISAAVLSCTKVFRQPTIKKVLMMEVLSETNFSAGGIFSPNYFVDISDYFKKKIKIMGIYKNELKQHCFPRSSKSIEALALLRGTQAGCRYAEAFMLLKGIY
jgi:LmbE family N-acetylglucosaminyl deacetylase